MPIVKKKKEICFMNVLDFGEKNYKILLNLCLEHVSSEVSEYTGQYEFGSVATYHCNPG